MHSRQILIMYNLVLVCLYLVLFVIDGVESQRYYYYSYYYTYYYYTYYSYYSYSLTPSEKGIVAGSVIGGLIIIFLIVVCCVYCFYYAGRSRSTPGTTIATVSGPAAYPPAAVVTTGYTFTSGTPGVILSAPPAYTESPSGVTNLYPFTAIGMENIDSKSRSNLVDNEVRPQ